MWFVRLDSSSTHSKHIALIFIHVTQIRIYFVNACTSLIKSSNNDSLPCWHQSSFSELSFRQIPKDTSLWTLFITSYACEYHSRLYWMEIPNALILSGSSKSCLFTLLELTINLLLPFSRSFQFCFYSQPQQNHFLCFYTSTVIVSAHTYVSYASETMSAPSETISKAN